jgi:hypothetical protein
MTIHSQPAPRAINPDDLLSNFYGRTFKVSLTGQGIEYLVNASCTGDALDEVIDYLEDHHPMMLLTDQQMEELDQAQLEEYISGGNHGRYLGTHNIRIEEVQGHD